MDLSPLGAVLAYQWQLLAAALCLYVVGVCVYRRFFHPLSKIPCPFLPAVTTLYQSYYNRRYYRHVEHLHKIYGPVVRINPHEVHLSDFENYDKIYSVRSKYTKPPKFYDCIGAPLSTFGLEDIEIHRAQRAVMNPLFSRKMALQLEGIIHDKADKICQLMQQGIDKGVPVDLHHAFRALSVDVISEYAFDKSQDLLEQDDLGAGFFRMIRGLVPNVYVFQQFPTLRVLAMKTPLWLQPYLSDGLGCVVQFQRDCIKRAQGVKRQIRDGKMSDRPNMFSMLLDPEDKPKGYQIPSDEVLWQEAFALQGAASDTTGNALTIAMFNMLWKPEIYEKLAQQLEDAFPDPNTKLEYVKLEQMPYLTAVIKESLRLSFPTPGRLPRVVPEPGATFNGHFVPAGNWVGMSMWMVHRDPQTFPDPMTFDPDRWTVGNADHIRKLDRHLVSFCRGSRQCLGMNLAWCELYVTLATFVRRFPRGLNIYKTTPLDMEYDDFYGAYHVEGRNWFKVTGEREQNQRFKIK